MCIGKNKHTKSIKVINRPRNNYKTTSWPCWAARAGGKGTECGSMVRMLGRDCEPPGGSGIFICRMLDPNRWKLNCQNSGNMWECNMSSGVLRWLHKYTSTVSISLTQYSRLHWVAWAPDVFAVLAHARALCCALRRHFERRWVRSLISDGENACAKQPHVPLKKSLALGQLVSYMAAAGRKSCGSVIQQGCVETLGHLWTAQAWNLSRKLSTHPATCSSAREREGPQSAQSFAGGDWWFDWMSIGFGWETAGFRHRRLAQCSLKLRIKLA